MTKLRRRPMRSLTYPYRHVPEPSPGVHRHQQARDLLRAQADATLRRRQRQIGRHPEVERPVRVERAEAQGDDRERDSPVQRGEDQPDRRATLAARFRPDRRLLHAALHPERRQRGHQADEEHRAPSVSRHDDGRDDGGRSVADRPGALHEAHGLAPMSIRPAFRDERRSRRPRAAHAEAEDEAAHGELPDRLREPARRGEHRIGEHAADHAGAPPVAVCHDAEQQAAGRRSQQRQRSEDAAHRFRNAEVGQNGRQHHRVDHDVEAVEQPPGRRGEQRAAGRSRGRAQPAEGLRFQRDRRRAGVHGQCVSAFSSRPRVSGPNHIRLAENSSATAIAIVMAVESSIPRSCMVPMRMGIRDPIPAAA